MFDLSNTMYTGIETLYLFAAFRKKTPVIISIESFNRKLNLEHSFFAAIAYCVTLLWFPSLAEASVRLASADSKVSPTILSHRHFSEIPAMATRYKLIYTVPAHVRR